MSPLLGSAGQKLLIWLFYEKSTSEVVDFELKKYSLGNLTKSFFSNPVLDLFYCAGGWRKNVSLLIVSAGE